MNMAGGDAVSVLVLPVTRRRRPCALETWLSSPRVLSIYKPSYPCATLSKRTCLPGKGQEQPIHHVTPCPVFPLPFPSLFAFFKSPTRRDHHDPFLPLHTAIKPALPASRGVTPGRSLPRPVAPLPLLSRRGLSMKQQRVVFAIVWAPLSTTWLAWLLKYMLYDRAMTAAGRHQTLTPSSPPSRA
ncbi:hypothetical protein F5144DRAFT_578176 [Chaetomium tenue]|uniref:Uncharacterized protein n=1 Tax=Chaetomium tenue TaxID=1854479 RepID=A0ACB7P6G0_9PEZI|nr:hypothetical protein F5144DRAFT_578176 [Chaetomium globosum]